MVITPNITIPSNKVIAKKNLLICLTGENHQVKFEWIVNNSYEDQKNFTVNLRIREWQPLLALIKFF